MKKLMENYLGLVDLGEIIAKVTGLELAITPTISFKTIKRYEYGFRWLVFVVDPQTIEFRIIQGNNIANHLDEFRIMGKKVAKKLKVRTLVTFGNESERKGVLYSFKEVKNELER